MSSAKRHKTRKHRVGYKQIHRVPKVLPRFSTLPGQQIDIDPLFDKADNPVAVDGRDDRPEEGKKFFEIRFIEYQPGGALSWD